VRIQQENDTLVFEVHDTGAGFEPTSQGRGAGMTNMMDRVGAVGGALRVDSYPGRGTTVKGTIPLRTMPPPGPSPVNGGGKHQGS